MTEDSWIFKEFKPRIIEHPELVCPQCESENVFLFRGKNSVVGCFDCGNSEELPQA